MSVISRALIFNLRRNERGDTIVEVLISILIVSVILTGAYVTTNTSLRTTRASEERTAALKLVQGQLELVKSMMASSAGATVVNSAPANFCIVPNTAVGAQPTTPGSTAAACQQDSNGNPTTQALRYKLAISKTGNIFTAQAKWDSIVNSGQDSVQMTYRVYP